MIDLTQLSKMKENQRLEVKKAKAGLPRSLWESYSAFANTDGGCILLGVEEYASGKFRVTGVDNPERLVDEFWAIVHNPKKVNLNLLSSTDVNVREIDGKSIIEIEVPAGNRHLRPIYLEGNMLNSFRRNGSGDYRCTEGEVRGMIRDSSDVSYDRTVLEELELSALSEVTIRAYRQLYTNIHPRNIWTGIPDEEFLWRIGAAAICRDGKKHPTVGGLLMFGTSDVITSVIPRYSLDFQDFSDVYQLGWRNRIFSDDGNWSGNVFDFFIQVSNVLMRWIATPFKMEGEFRIEDSPLHKAVREALINCLSNADYFGRGGVVVRLKPEGFSFCNPGRFRIPLADALEGGNSDPRNPLIFKFFYLLSLGEKAGMGVPSIYQTWQKEGWGKPEFIESVNPERVTLFLYYNYYGKISAINNDYGVSEKILNYLSTCDEAPASSISRIIGLKSSRTRDYLNRLIDEEKVTRKGGNKNRTYSLKK